MEIEELQKKKKEYERRLINIIDDQINSFKLETGLDIKSIDVRFADVTRIESDKKEYVFDGVRIFLDI